MPPSPIYDLTGLDPDRVLYDGDEIEAVNPHRGVMRLIDHVIWEAPDRDGIVAVKKAREDEFWVPGHIPGRPLFPGVLQIEAAAQASSFVVLRREEEQEFMGFVACDGFKFRGHVTPGDTLLVLAKQIDFRRRRQQCLVQGYVDQQMVFEGTITGMPM